MPTALIRCTENHRNHANNITTLPPNILVRANEVVMFYRIINHMVDLPNSFHVCFAIKTTQMV